MPDLSPNNLPLQLTSFVGRERESVEVKRLLAAARLLTLTGAGGCGKTRLALRVAAEFLNDSSPPSAGRVFPDGAWFVDLARLSDPALVPQSIASVFDLRESPGNSLITILQNYFRAKRLLLALDNCEHLIQACAQLVDTLLRACPDLKILATSREALNIAGETAFRVPSLSLPDPQKSASIEAMQQSESVRLFIERANAASPTAQFNDANVPTVKQICLRLDGMPLAIELAAARVNSISVEEIAARLDDRFRLLTSGSRTALARHQTLRASIDWSYNLLSDGERVLLRRLAVFAGGFTLQAAESVCAEENSSDILDALSRLVQKSLVVVKLDDKPRYRLLETIRQYAQEKLIESGEADRVKARHLDYFMRLAEGVSLGWLGFGQAAWLMRLKAEHDNLRAALEWSAADETTAQIGLKLVGLVAPFLDVQGYFTEERNWIDRLLERAGESAPPAWRAVAFQRAAVAQENLANFATARSCALQAITLFRELGDKKGLAESLYIWGDVLCAQAQFTEARPVLKECLTICQDLGDSVGTAWSLSDLGLTEYALGNHRLAQSYMEQGLELCRKGKWGFIHSRTAWLLGDIFRHEGNLAQALSLYKEALNIAKGGIAWALPYHIESFAYLALGEGFTLRAAKLLGAGNCLFETLGAVRVPVTQSEHDRAMVDLREALGEEALAAAWTEGRAMTTEQAIEYALAEPDRDERTKVSPQTMKEKFGGLTPREREVAVLIAQGKSNPEIAEALVVSERTVTTHVSNILSKLGFTSRTQVASWATEKRLTK